MGANKVQRSALVARPATHLFDLIEAAEHYPQFIPWCVGATILVRSEEEVSADLRVRIHGLAFEMRTRNPKRRPEFMAIHLERGPFRHFEGQWKLTQLGTMGCRVDFLLDWELDSSILGSAATPVFARAAGTLVDAFVERAMSMPEGNAAPPPPSPSLPPTPAA